MPSAMEQSGNPTGSGPGPTQGIHAPTGVETIIPLHVEEVSIDRRAVAKTVVRVATVTHSRPHLAETERNQVRVEIDRVPMGRYVDDVPPVRVEGDVTIMPVVEEVIIVTRKIMLVEEVRIRQIRTTEQYSESVQLRCQEAVVTRTPVDNRDDAALIPQNLQSELSK